jgi:LPXTG-site transpeptidase (sortase) family protein
MPTHAPNPDEGRADALDEPIPEAELGPTDVDGLDAFLHTVRALVHGEPTPGAAVDETAPSPVDIWEPEPASRRARRRTRRAARKAEEQARRHERKLERAERRSLRARRRSAAGTVHPPVEVEQSPSPEPDAAPQRIPAQADGREVAQGHGAPGVTEPASSRRERRRRRRQEAALAITAAVPAVEPEPPTVVAAEAPGTTVTARRARGRRRRKARSDVVAPQVDTLDDLGEVEAETAADAVVGPDVDTVVDRASTPGRVGSGGPRRPRSERRFTKEIVKAVGRGESGTPPAEPETLAEYVARVDAGRLRRRKRRSRPRTPLRVRRTTRVAVAVAVVAVCAALPWIAPSVPQAISDLFPDNGSAPGVADPTVAPPTDAFVGPVGVVQQAGPLVGVRLQSAGEPREVRVPRLHVDSDVVRISGQSGSLLPPSDPQLLGWWQEGRWAGAGTGTAVVTGHTVHTGGGALDQLDQLVVGDGLRVRTDNGWIRYVVQRTRIYSTEQLARDADQIFRLDGPGRLVLITCDDWNGSFYESNAVVFAAPVEDLPTVSATETGVPDPGIAGD